MFAGILCDLLEMLKILHLEHEFLISDFISNTVGSFI